MLPTWMSKNRPQKKTEIEYWGKPYNGFTCVVDGEAWVPTKVGSSSTITWRLCSDYEETCVWKKGTASDVKNARECVWKKQKSKKSCVFVPKKKMKEVKKVQAKKRRK
eukprot:gnl/MRDRNA2_/MRDRNA2_20357_c0_seq2.p1 gnl/MRDRNA2_/MRDRNA2_20357_c0~~gnl/MRDRNA2_/MRDRNA2_20357_c0_seq2.p1  ORF type:complete len:108 (+),score=23.02 gnl/MRDRNA2_/MRDRNA2_20357_c0_seq2:118-441(+)